MRKKTSNQDLAKRGRKLVRKWQELVLAPQSTTPRPNGIHPSKTPTQENLHLRPSKSGLLRPETPQSQSSNSPKSLTRCATEPRSLQSSKSNTAFRPISPAHSAAARNSPTTTAGVSQNGHSKRDGNGVAASGKRKADSPLLPNKRTCPDVVSRSSSSKHSPLNGLTTHDEKPSMSSLHRVQHQQQRVTSPALSNASSSQAPAAKPAALPRVKTTAELLKEMSGSGRINLKGCEAAKRIELNQIEREELNERPVLPPGVKPRHHRKRRQLVAPPETTAASLNKTKNEMVHKFLATSVCQPPTPDSDFPAGESPSCGSVSSPATPSTADHTHTTTKHNNNNTSNSTSSFKRDNGSDVTDEDGTKRVAPVRIRIGARQSSHEVTTADSSSCTATAQIVSNSAAAYDVTLPPIDPTQIDWGSLEYDAPPPPEERAPVTPSVIERLHGTEWSGVNGRRDAWGDWRNWTQSMSLRSFDNNLLHILPYVVLDQVHNNDDNEDDATTPTDKNTTTTAADVTTGADVTSQQTGSCDVSIKREISDTGNS